jgi:hypothetical protein
MSKTEEWLMILGDDDYYSSNLIETFYELHPSFQDQVNVVRFSKQNIFIDKNEVSEIQNNPEFEFVNEFYYRRITGKTTSSLSEYAFKRTVFEKFGFYHYPLAWQSDNRAWIEFTDGKPIFSINKAIVYVTSSYQSISGSTLFGLEKKNANLAFYKYLITDKLYLFDKHQSIRILQKYENELKHNEKLSFKNTFFLLYYYLKKFEKKSFILFLKKMIKSLLHLN